MSKCCYCPKCGTKLPDASNFCPGCGVNLLRPQMSSKLTSRQLVTLLLVALIIWLPAWNYQKWKSGAKPTQTFEEAQGGISNENENITDPAILDLKKIADAQPTNLEAQQQLAALLVEKIRSSDAPSNQMLFEAIEVLTKILKIKPDDLNALIALADITFNQQVFAKAVEYYGRYLKVKPQDHTIRARYGSALAFNGDYKDAIKELKLVLDKDPKNFHANAYLAITYAQMGDTKLALQAAEKTLPLAPNEEAKGRFTRFMDDIKNGQLPSPNNSKQAEQETASVTSVSDYIKSNSIAGSKFVEAVLTKDGNLLLYFKDFPMSNMPEFAKNKFISGIKDKAAQIKDVNNLVFLDKGTGQELAKANVK